MSVGPKVHEGSAQSQAARGEGEVPPPHAASSEDVLLRLSSDERRGMDDTRAAQVRAQYGPNELTEAPPAPAWKRLADQFQQLVIWILVGAAIISGILGDWTDSVVILAIVLLNGLLGFLQEERAGQALAALRKLSVPQARVMRDGSLRVLPAKDLVPGDVIQLEAGDNVPADARLVRAVALRAQESALTGESTPVSKDHRPVLARQAPLADRTNMVHMGTVIAAGQATAVVVAIGMGNELGRIAGMLGARRQEPTPLQRRLDELGRLLLLVCLAAVALVFALQLARGGGVVEGFLLSVSLAVAAVPEGLPAIVTIALAVGLQRMVRRNALIRKLPSVETLGCVTVICSDKTGTLTRNEMTVREVYADGRRFEISGTGYRPQGDFSADGRAVDIADSLGLRRALAVGAWCNHAQVQPSETGDAWHVVGDPTEAALLVAARKGKVDPADRRRHHVLFEIPFDSDRKAMSVVVAGDAAGQGMASGAVMYTKGAPEVVLAMCSQEIYNGHLRPLTAERREHVAGVAADMASRALRVLGLAYRQHNRRADDLYAEEDLVLAGLAGMIDPPREEVKDALRRCGSAGIRTVMITGDHPSTGLAIARELGITAGDGTVVTGADLDKLTDEALAGRGRGVAVYARVTAEHKLRIVRALRAAGEVVAMTGDGVNDAPAVDEADIGIAMGVAGTDVTKAAADVVLTDDNFASIVNAVEEGRGIFDNIQKFVHYLLASNASEVMFMLFAALAGWPVPLLAIQLLWINLVTDSLPAIGLGMEPTERDVMRRRPRPLREPVITRWNGLRILAHGAMLSAAVCTAFALTYQGDAASLDRSRTVAFATLAFAQLFFAMACRSNRYTMPEIGPFTNPRLLVGILLSCALQAAAGTIPIMQGLFKAAPLGWEQWLVVLTLAATPVTLIEVVKWLPARGRPAGAQAYASAGLIRLRRLIR
jgi:Ca2+-transporting ATPase